MKKVKLNVSHSTLVSLADGLNLLIGKIKTVSTSDKIRLALWIECWLVIQEKEAWPYQGEKKLSLSVPRALSLMEAIQLLSPQGEYEQATFLQLIGSIDQQTV